MSNIGFWRTRSERYRLVGTECPHCDARYAFPRLVCSVCGRPLEALDKEIFPTVETPPADERVAVTVIIPAYNAKATIRGTLDSLAAQQDAPSYEVIVVDSSKDGTDQIIAEAYPWVKLIHQSEKTDPGMARNLGLSASHGQVIACLDADCIAPKDWLARIMADQRAGHEVVGGAVENGKSQSAVAWAGYMGEFREFIPSGRPRIVSHIPTCNIAYHRTIFERFGGFPTRFYPQEDLLYHWRLGHHGVPLWFDPGLIVQHMHRSTWRGYLQHQHRIGKITTRMLQVTGGEGAFLARSPLLTLLSVPALPLVKWGRTLAAFWSRQPGTVRKHVPAVAVLLIGLYAWMLGFVAGTFGPPLHWVDGEGLTWQPA